LLAESFPGDALVAEEDASALQGTPLLEQVTAYVRYELPASTPASVCGWIDRGASAPTTRFWTLDPIDGTKGFLRGDQYAVALALVENGRVQIGVLGCPNLSDGYRPDHGGEGSIAIACEQELGRQWYRRDLRSAVPRIAVRRRVFALVESGIPTQDRWLPAPWGYLPARQWIASKILLGSVKPF
jgi:3'-phosphoadenosine 5'-phosphosulfate (PAPS) 3'-phosphatase